MGYHLDKQILLGTEGSTSGGYLSYILRYAAYALFGIHITPQDIANGTNGIDIVHKQGRSKNSDFVQVNLRDPQSGNVLLRFAGAYGFKNIQNVVRKIKSGISSEGTALARRRPATGEDFHYIEIMACPSGCINGGGQLKEPRLSSKEWVLKSEASYYSTRQITGIQPPDQNDAAMSIYQSLNPEQKQAFLYTDYVAVEKNISNSLGVKW